MTNASHAFAIFRLCSCFCPPILFSRTQIFVVSSRPPLIYLIRSRLCSSFSSPSSDEDSPTSPHQVFRLCGCTDNEISKIFHRQPALLNANISKLQSKINLLLGLGFTGSDLVTILNRRPRLLASHLGRQGFDDRIQYLQTIFGSKEMLLKAIMRNPSLLNYQLHDRIKCCVDIYLQIGITKEDLAPLLISRPKLIPCISLSDEKLDYIRRTGVPSDSKMYKYVVSLIAISRLETIREKVANFEKFGISSDEVLELFGRSPMVLTISIDKVQRNMTFLIGNMKLPATIILRYPFLLYSNLELVLKPRHLLAEKIRVMGLAPQIKGPALMRALRMAEPRFCKAFINCHSEDVSKQLMDFYSKAKCIKRLA